MEDKRFEIQTAATAARRAIAAPLSPAVRAVIDPPAVPRPGEGITLQQLWRIVRLRLGTIAVIVVIITALVAIWSVKTDPVYRATARIEVDPDTSTIQSVQQMTGKADDDANDEFATTQVQVLKSDSLAWTTIEQLHLDRNPRFVRKRNLFNIFGSTKQLEKPQLIQLFEDSLTVELLPNTRMITIDFEGNDPQMASDVATALVNNYIEHNFRERYDSTRQVSNWMEQQLGELKLNVERSQQALVDYEREHSIATTGENANGTKQNMSEQMLSDMSRELASAQADRIQKQARYEQVQANPALLASLSDNDLLHKLQEHEADLRSQYATATQEFGPNYPKVLKLQADLKELEASIAREQQNVIGRVRQDYMAAVNRENLATHAVDRQKVDQQNTNALLVQHNILQRDFDSNQQMYQALLQKLKDATVSAGLRSTNIHIIDTATRPNRPVRPRIALNIILAFLVSLVLSVIGCVFESMLDHSVKSIDEIEDGIGLPALGTIPDEAPKALSKGMPKNSKALVPSKKAEMRLAEAFRALQTSVMLSTSGAPPKLLMVTSCRSGEGKTTTTLNLARVMAQRKGPVLVVDCDLRKCDLSRKVSRASRIGLSSVLAGDADLESVIQPVHDMPGLWVLPAGHIAPNPTELIWSEKMFEVLQRLRDRYEHIIIDSSPGLVVTDAIVLGTMVDGVIIVAESRVTPLGAIRRLHKTLTDAGARVLGVSLNKVDLSKGLYYGYQYGYGDPYGYGADADTEAKG